jgi:transposase
MFVKVTQSGGRRYAQLVESFRNEQGKPRQRTICTLGRLEPGGAVDTLIDSLNRAQGRDSQTSVNPLDELRFMDSRNAGDVWAVAQLWRSLGLDDLAHAWRGSRVELDVLACLRSMVFNRLCDPSSKLGVLRWLDSVAWPADFGFDDAPPSHQHLLRAMDVLDEHSAALGERMAALMRPLIDQDLSVVFYDLTTVEIAGEAVVTNDVRLKGRSKSGLIERQFMLSLVQTAEGLPIAHEVHPGNTAEAKTLLPMITELLARYALKRVVLIADRGLLNVSNLDQLAQLQQTLRAQKRDITLEYILAVPAARYGEFADALGTLAAAQTKDQAWVGETTWADPDEPDAPTRRLVVAHDPQAAARRMQQRQATIDELIQQGQQWSGKLDQQDAGQRGRGKPLSDSGAKARFYHAVRQASLAHVIQVDLKTDAFTYSLDEDKQRYLELLDGKLLLVTNTLGPAEQVVQRYKSLADIERGFRVLKSDIEIGPVYHRLPKRIRAHSLVCFIALVIYRVMRMRLKASQREESPSRLLEQLRRIHQQTVQTADGQTLTGLTEMGALQKALFKSINIPTPTPANLAKPRL